MEQSDNRNWFGRNWKWFVPVSCLSVLGAVVVCVAIVGTYILAPIALYYGRDLIVNAENAGSLSELEWLSASMLGEADSASSSAEGGTRRRTSVFNEIGRDSVDDLELEDLKKGWYQAPVTCKSGMFNPVFLPFTYECRNGSGDSKQPLTFPCLLSFKFDFVPDNYCARHPGFVFRKKRVWDVRPGEIKKIAEYVTYWEATHAIGGRVIESEDGYSGELLVFDRYGMEIHRDTYDEPVPYFTLMGKMVQSWMGYRRQEVSAGLYAELMRPMTGDMACVRMYGSSFDKEWRSDGEWEVYESILQRDPDFAEVRFWYANQKSWATDDHVSLQVEKGRAVLSHLVMPALNEFDYENCADEAVVAGFHKALAHAEEICRDHSVVLSVKLKVKGDNLSVSELDELLPMAEKYPSNWNFIVKLAFQYRKRGCYEKSIPLFLSAIQSGYLKGTGGFDWEFYLLALDFYKLGYIDESIFCGVHALADCSEERMHSILWYLGQATREKNYYRLCATLFARREEVKEDSWGSLYACLSAYQSGDPGLLKEFENCDLARKNLSSLKEARAFAAKGMFDAALSQLPEVRPDIRLNSKEFQLQEEIIRADIYMLSGNIVEARKHAVRAWYVSPRSRQVGRLLERSAVEDKVWLGRYAKVGLFICRDDPCWKSILHRSGQSAEENREVVIGLFEDIEGKLDGLTGSEQCRMWQQLRPFEIEYVCLFMLKLCDESISEKALDLYVRYAKYIKFISEQQRMHTRTFFIQLVSLLEEEDRVQWMSLLDRL